MGKILDLMTHMEFLERRARNLFGRPTRQPEPAQPAAPLRLDPPDTSTSWTYEAIQRLLNKEPCREDDLMPHLPPPRWDGDDDPGPGAA